MPNALLNSPVLLTKDHQTASFDCGVTPLNDFLTRYALQNQASGGARTYVLTRSERVVGYYSLAPGSVVPDDAPARVIKGQGRYPVPIILMARFAIDSAEQGKGLGRAFLVHAKDEAARTFYLQFGMEQSPTNPLHLFLLFKDIRQSLEAAG